MNSPSIRSGGNSETGYKNKYNKGQQLSSYTRTKQVSSNMIDLFYTVGAAS